MKKTIQKGKKSGKAATRSETVSVRLEPKLRYLADLAARSQRRTLSSFIEWAVEHSLGDVGLMFPDHSVTLSIEMSGLWDIDPADRFAKLAIRYEYLLNHEEQVLWKLIRENGYLWKGTYDKKGDYTWNPEHEHALILPRLREHWDSFNLVARKDASANILPTWKKTNQGPEPSSAEG